MTWKKVKLGDILTESKIESDKPDPDKRITVRLNVKGIEKRPFEAGVEGGTKYYVRKAQQFIYGKQNLFKGAFGIIPKELDNFESSQDIPAFDISKDCLPEWIFYYFKQNNFYKTLESLATGTGSRRIQPSRLFEVEIPLPEIHEQKRLIKEITKRDKGFDALFEEINQQQSYLQLLHKTLLQEAVKGKLTKQEKNDEPASELLKRIKANKEKLIKEGKLKKEKELSPITENEIPFELPKGWVWCRLGEVTDLKSGVTLGKIYKDELIEVPYLRVANVQRGSIDISHVKKLKVPKYEIEKYKLQKGDLCMVEGGDWDKVGRCAIWRYDIEPCIHQNHIFRLRFYGNISIEWSELYLNSPIARRYFESFSKQTTNLASINKTQLTGLLFPLPPLSEQQRIVSKVQQLQEQLTALEMQMQQSRQYSQQLLQAILKEAFGVSQKDYATNEQLTMAAEE